MSVSVAFSMESEVDVADMTKHESRSHNDGVEISHGYSSNNIEGHSKSSGDDHSGNTTDGRNTAKEDDYSSNYNYNNRMRRSSPFIVDLVILYRWYSVFLVSTIVMCCVMVVQSATVFQNYHDNLTTSGQRLICQSKYRYTCYDKNGVKPSVCMQSCVPHRAD